MRVTGGLVGARVFDLRSGSRQQGQIGARAYERLRARNTPDPDHADRQAIPGELVGAELTVDGNVENTELAVAPQCELGARAIAGGPDHGRRPRGLVHFRRPVSAPPLGRSSTVTGG
jgi:hypothetical protein